MNWTMINDAGLVVSSTIGTPGVGMVGASAGAAGAMGLVPQPAAGDNTKFLRGDAVWASAGAAGAMVEIVARTTLSGSLSSINLGSIPATYYGLLLILELRSDKAGNFEDVRLRMNGDTTNANYYSWGTAFGAATPGFLGNIQNLGAANGMRIARGCPGATAPTNQFSQLELWLWNYSLSARPRCCNWLGYNHGADTDASIETLLGGGTWRNSSAAINQLTVVPEVGSNFVAGSSYALFGIGAA